jgi:integrase
MATISTTDVRAYIADRQQQGYANATINRELSALKRMFVLAIQADKLLHRPYIPKLDENNVRQGFLERAQFDAIRQRLPPLYQALIMLAYYTGWRINSELLPLEWRQIDRAAGVIRREPGTTKNRDGRTFKFAELVEFREAIDALWQRHEALAEQGVITPLVFCRRKGQRIRTFHKRLEDGVHGGRLPNVGAA